jgi:hypothetical protein
MGGYCDRSKPELSTLLVSGTFYFAPTEIESQMSNRCALLCAIREAILLIYATWAKSSVAAITGGSKGIGKAIGHGLAAEGVSLGLMARRKEQAAWLYFWRRTGRGISTRPA